MIQLTVFPQGKKRIVTFSYDDGPEGDVRLISLFNRYGVKGTFHLNGGKYRGMAEDRLNAIRDLYRGHEIACHTLHHGFIRQMTHNTLVREVLEDRRILEKIAGYPVTGMSYPCGEYNDDIEKVMESCDIAYSRTTRNTMDYHLPDCFLRWDPTCHHRDALDRAENFMSRLDDKWCRPLLYIWGHSFEFRSEEDWAYMEKVLQTVSHNDKIWYATNGEIRDYLAATHSLIVSADETMVKNPTATDVWIDKDGRIVQIPAGKTVCL